MIVMSVPITREHIGSKRLEGLIQKATAFFPTIVHQQITHKLFKVPGKKARFRAATWSALTFQEDGKGLKVCSPFYENSTSTLQERNIAEFSFVPDVPYVISTSLKYGIRFLYFSVTQQKRKNDYALEVLQLKANADFGNLNLYVTENWKSLQNLVLKAQIEGPQPTKFGAFIDAVEHCNISGHERLIEVLDSCKGDVGKFDKEFEKRLCECRPAIISYGRIYVRNDQIKNPEILKKFEFDLIVPTQ